MLPPMTVPLGRLPRALGVAVAVLVLLHVAVMVVHYRIMPIDWLIRGLFDLDEEQSFGTWLSSGILAIAAGLLLLHARELRAIDGPMTRAWWWLGVGFVFLSADEVAGLHESLNSAISFSCAIPGAVVALLVGLAYIPFLRRLPASTRWWFVVSGAIYVGGAVGVEFATEPFDRDDRLDTLAYNLSTALEEGMEMVGVVLFIRALVRHIAATAGSARVDLDPGA